MCHFSEKFWKSFWIYFSSGLRFLAPFWLHFENWKNGNWKKKLFQKNSKQNQNNFKNNIKKKFKKNSKYFWNIFKNNFKTIFTKFSTWYFWIPEAWLNLALYQWVWTQNQGFPPYFDRWARKKFVLLITSTNSNSELRKDFLDRKKVLKSLEANSSISPQNYVIRPG